jgi:hypothetical protein
VSTNTFGHGLAKAKAKAKTAALLKAPIYVTVAAGTCELLEAIGRTDITDAQAAASSLGGIVANYDALCRKYAPTKIQKLTQVIEISPRVEAHLESERLKARARRKAHAFTA